MSRGFFVSPPQYKSLQMSFIFHHSNMVQCISENMNIITAALSQWKHLRKLEALLKQVTWCGTTDTFGSSFKYECDQSRKPSCLPYSICQQESPSEGYASLAAISEDRKNSGYLIFLIMHIWCHHLIIFHWIKISWEVAVYF